MPAARSSPAGPARNPGPPHRALMGRRVFLLTSLVLQLLLLPYLTGRAGGILVSVLFTAVLVAGVYAAGRSRSVRVIALILAGLALLGSWSVVFSHLLIVQVVQMVCAGLFYTFLTFVVLQAVLRPRRVTADTLYGAASVYLLLGFAWATLYAILELLRPGSFMLAATAGQYAEPAFFDLIYYSFVTLTTLGYGEIIPVAPLARSLAVLEAAGGVLYLAVLVARLVGLYGRDRTLGETE